jgi:hypothetical protein
VTQQDLPDLRIIESADLGQARDRCAVPTHVACGGAGGTQILPRMFARHGGVMGPRVGKIEDDFAHPTVSSLQEVQEVPEGCRTIDFLHFLQFVQPVRAAAIRSDWPAPP